MHITAPRDYIEAEHDYSTGTLYIYTYKEARDSGRLHILEYVDIETGEIVQKKKARIKEIRPDAMLERFRRLDLLRPEIRNFATFILRFRNQACGFLVPMETLIGWYARLTGKIAKNVRRCISPLIENGILQDENTVEKIFMVNNPNRNARQAKGDRFKAETIFSMLLLKKS